jgi:hypothetical protein
MQPKFIIFTALALLSFSAFGQLDEDEKNFTNQLYKDYCKEIDSTLAILCAAKNSKSLQQCGQSNNRYDKIQSRNTYLWSHRKEMGDVAYWKEKKKLVDSLISLSSSISVDLSMIEHYDDAQLMKEPGGVNKFLAKQQNKRIEANQKFVMGLDADDIDEGEGIGLNLSAALPFINHPIIRNNTMYNSAANNQSINYSAYSTLQAFAGLNFGAEFHVFRTPNINFQLFASGTYTNNGVFSSMIGEKDQTSEYYDYQGGGALYLGIPRIKVFGEFLYGGRMMSYLDFTKNDYGVAGTVQQSAYYYHDLTFMRITGGLKFNFNSEDGKSNFLKLKFAMEKPNHINDGVSIWGLGLEYRSFIDLRIAWFPKYTPGGMPDFKLQDPEKKPAFTYVTLGKSFTLF